MKLLPGALFVLLVCPITTTRADFFGPIAATHATSPDGNLQVRITLVKQAEEQDEKPSYNVVFYKFDAAKDSYARHQSFALDDYPGQLMYLSDAGDLVLISLSEKKAIVLYSPEGKRLKTWDLAAFLTKKEIKGCAKTGSTLQWLDEAGFDDRTFWFSGASDAIRGLQPSYTIMRGRNPKVSFSGEINAEEAELTKHDKVER